MTDDPLDIPLPCEITINHITFDQGVSLRTFVNAAQRWHDEAKKNHKAELLIRLAETAKDCRSAGDIRYFAIRDAHELLTRDL